MAEQETPWQIAELITALECAQMQCKITQALLEDRERALARLAKELGVSGSAGYIVESAVQALRAKATKPKLETAGADAIYVYSGKIERIH